jgi:hypothetical protein
MSNESAQKTLYLGKLDEILDTWIEAFAKGIALREDLTQGR